MEPAWVSGVVANIRKVQAIIRWDSWERDGFDGPGHFIKKKKKLFILPLYE